MISTKNIDTGSGSSIPKTLSPGVQVVKINSITLSEVPYKKGAFNLLLNVEGPDMGEEFEGFYIDNDDHSLGRYDGPVGTVKTTKWYYADGETRNGDPVNRDMEIMKFLKKLCIRAGEEAWFAAIDGKYNTIEEMVNGINKSKVFKNKWFKICTAGREYPKKDSKFVGVDLFLPYDKGGKVSFELANTENSKLLTYNESEMLEKYEDTETVNGFGSDTEEVSSDSFMDDAPEFEL